MVEIGTEERIVGGILGLVVGDALGVPVEFKRTPELDGEIRRNRCF